MDSQLLAGKIALVTGGNSGIGLGTARRLVGAGAFVYITGRRKDALDRAQAVAPGVVPTEGYGKDVGWSEDYVRQYKERVSKEILVGRVGSVDDIGNAVVYLSSEMGCFVNGVELTVDGGMTQIYQGRNGAE